MSDPRPAFDLQPATDELTRIVRGVRDDQLGLPTPCEAATVGDLLDHVDGFARAFTRAAAKALTDGSAPPPPPDARRLAPDWRTAIPARLAALAEAWRTEDAWSGMTRVGGIDLPGHVTAAVAADELLVHAWDLAAATGQTVDPDPGLLAAAHGFVRATVAESPQGRPGLFGPPVPVPEDAPLLDRVIGLTGRDPAWRAGSPAAAH